MKHAWKYSRFAAALLTAALLLTSGVLAKGGLVTAIGDYEPAWVKVEESTPEDAAQLSAQETAPEDTAQPSAETAETLAVPAEESVDEGAGEETVSGAEETAGETALPEETAPETTSQESEPYIQPAAQLASDWRLLLVNPWNDLPEDYAVELVSLSNGLQVDRRIYEDLEDMLSACRAAGLNPIVCSAYRTEATQTRLYNNKIARLRSAGWTGDALLTEAARWVAPPGTSEHQTGLALDIVSARYQVLDSAQANTAEQQWLMAHCWEYGFILRYPADKTEITGIGYEPWHYRYVGRETAAAVHESGLCLEEYLQTLPPPAKTDTDTVLEDAAAPVQLTETVPAEVPEASAASTPADTAELPGEESALVNLSQEEGTSEESPGESQTS